MTRLASKTICITGASAGIGEACARLFAKEGARLIITGRRQERLEALKVELHTDVHTCAFDIRNRLTTEDTIRELPEDFKPIDVLVNNAGLALGLEPFTESPLTDFDAMIETNIQGLLTMTREILPGMIARGSGHIVTIGSIAGTYPYAGGHVYGATKAFVKQFALGLRADLLGHPIRVTNIEPGMVDTEFSGIRFKGDEARAQAVYEGVEPLHAEDIAEAVLWAITLPPHVNINRIEMMATMQAPGGAVVFRDL